MRNKDSHSVRVARRITERLALKYEEKFTRRKVRFCPKCGIKIQNQMDIFCRKCGFKLR